MRGLKQGAAYAKTIAETSHLLQMRGLKLAIDCAQRRGQYVASFTDAWIETNAPHFTCEPPFRRIFYRCVD